MGNGCEGHSLYPSQSNFRLHWRFLQKLFQLRLASQFSGVGAPSWEILDPPLLKHKLKQKYFYTHVNYWSCFCTFIYFDTSCVQIRIIMILSHRYITYTDHLTFFKDKHYHLSICNQTLWDIHGYFAETSQTWILHKRFFCNGAKDALIRDSECCDTQKYYSNRYHIMLA